MEQYIDEYLRTIFGNALLEDQPVLPKMQLSKKEKVGQTLSKGVTGVGSGITKAGQWVSKQAGTVAKHPVAAGAALGATALGAGYLAHQKYLSAAARACSQYSGRQKEACVSKYRAGGFKAEMLSLKENCIICNESPDKEGCLDLVRLRFSELQKKLTKLN